MPLLSIVEATAEAVLGAKLRSVGLLGTVFTMSERFFREGLEHEGLTVLVPDADDQQLVNKVIYEELCRGEVRSDSRQRFLGIVGRLRERGAEGIVLGCTEIPLLLETRHCDLPLFNTALLHAGKALDFALHPTR